MLPYATHGHVRSPHSAWQAAPPPVVAPYLSLGRPQTSYLRPSNLPHVNDSVGWQSRVTSGAEVSSSQHVVYGTYGQPASTFRPLATVEQELQRMMSTSNLAPSAAREVQAASRQEALCSGQQSPAVIAEAHEQQRQQDVRGPTASTEQQQRVLDEQSAVSSRGTPEAPDQQPEQTCVKRFCEELRSGKLLHEHSDFDLCIDRLEEEEVLNQEARDVAEKCLKQVAETELWAGELTREAEQLRDENKQQAQLLGGVGQQTSESTAAVAECSDDENVRLQLLVHGLTQQLQSKKDESQAAEAAHAELLNVVSGQLEDLNGALAAAEEWAEEAEERAANAEAALSIAEVLAQEGTAAAKEGTAAAQSAGSAQLSWRTVNEAEERAALAETRIDQAEKRALDADRRVGRLQRRLEASSKENATGIERIEGLLTQVAELRAVNAEMGGTLSELERCNDLQSAALQLKETAESRAHTAEQQLEGLEIQIASSRAQTRQREATSDEQQLKHASRLVDEAERRFDAAAAQAEEAEMQVQRQLALQHVAESQARDATHRVLQANERALVLQTQLDCAVKETKNLRFTVKELQSSPAVPVLAQLLSPTSPAVNELQRCQQECVSLRAEIDDQKELTESFRANMQQLQARLRHTSNHNDQTTTAVDREERAAVLRRAAKAEEQHLLADQRVDRLQRKLDEQAARVEDLLGELDHLRSTNDEMAAANGNMAAALSERCVDGESSKALRLKEAEVHQLQQVVHQLQSDKGGLQHVREQLRQAGEATAAAEERAVAAQERAVAAEERAVAAEEQSAWTADDEETETLGDSEHHTRSRSRSTVTGSSRSRSISASSNEIRMYKQRAKSAEKRADAVTQSALVVKQVAEDLQHQVTAQRADAERQIAEAVQRAMTAEAQLGIVEKGIGRRGALEESSDRDGHGLRRKQAGELQAALDWKEAELAEAAAKVAELQGLLDDFAKQAGELQAALDWKEAELAEAAEKVAEMETAMHESRMSQAQKQARLDDLNSEATHLRAMSMSQGRQSEQQADNLCKAHERAIQQALVEKNEMKKRLAALEESRATLEKDLAQAQLTQAETAGLSALTEGLTSRLRLSEMQLADEQKAKTGAADVVLADTLDENRELQQQLKITRSRQELMSNQLSRFHVMAKEKAQQDVELLRLKEACAAMSCATLAHCRTAQEVSSALDDAEKMTKELSPEGSRERLEEEVAYLQERSESLSPPSSPVMKACGSGLVSQDASDPMVRYTERISQLEKQVVQAEECTIKNIEKMQRRRSLPDLGRAARDGWKKHAISTARVDQPPITPRVLNDEGEPLDGLPRTSWRSHSPRNRASKAWGATASRADGRAASSSSSPFIVRSNSPLDGK